MDSEKMQDKPIFFLDTLNVLDESSFQIKQKKQSSKWEKKKSAGQCIKGKVLRFSQWFCLQRLILWNHKVRYSLRPHSPDLPAVLHCCGLYFWFSKRPSTDSSSLPWPDSCEWPQFFFLTSCSRLEWAWSWINPGICVLWTYAGSTESS